MGFILAKICMDIINVFASNGDSKQYLYYIAVMKLKGQSSRPNCSNYGEYFYMFTC